MRIFNGFYKREDKDFLNQMTDIKIASEILTRKIKSQKWHVKDPNKREWTLEELQFMKDNWGKLSKKQIAENLNRGYQGLIIKAGRIGLKNYFVYSEEVTLNHLYRLITGGQDLHGYELGILTRYGLPYDYSTPCKTAAYRSIKISDFLEWFENNKRVINLCNSEEGCFGVDEPKWLKIKRKADKRAAAYGPHNRKWTPEEDAKLTEMVNSQKYGYREISITLKRTEGALKRRMVDLKMEKRPPKAYNHNMWTEKEINKVRKMWLQGFQSCIISEYLPGRSALAINGLLERHKYFGDPPLKYKL